jgi:hypothetical protein
MEIEAVLLSGKWFVRPAGQLGTCGFYPVPWELTHIKRARSAEDAIRKASSQVRWLQEI